MYGFTNYHTNYGRWVGVTNAWDGVFGTNFVPFGSVPVYPATKIVDISDGTTNTVMFAEVANGDNGNTPARRDPRRDCLDGGTIPRTSMAAARNHLLGINVQTAGSLSWNWRGYPWREGSIWRNGMNTLMPPNSGCFRPSSGQWWELVTPASSYHSGGVNVGLADGSVKFVRDGVDRDVWTGVGSKSGGEIGSLD